MAKNLSIVANGISGDEGHLLGYNVSDNGIYTPAIGDVVRGTTATYIAQDGLLKTAPPNVARVDYTNGVAELLLEPSATNLAAYSENFSLWAMGVSTIVQGGFTAPNGEDTAYRLQLPKVSSTRLANGITTPISGQTYTFSVWIKQNGLDDVFIGFGDSASTPNDLVSQKITPSTKWERYEISYTTANTNTLYFGLDNGGNGYNSDVLVFGGQFEAFDSATSYIPTNGATATRSADSLTNFGSSQIIDSSSGVLFFEGSTIADNTYITINDGTAINRITTYFTNDTLVARITVGNSTKSTLLGTSNTGQSNNKYVFRYSSGDLELFINGVSVFTTNSTFTMPQLKSIDFGRGGGTNPFFGRIRQVKHLPYNANISKL